MVLLRVPVAAALAAGALSACTPLMKGAVDTLRAGVAPPPALVVSRDEVMARPSFQLRVDSPFGSAIMLLARVEGERQYWVTSSSQVLVIEHGLIRRSTGFPENIEATRFVGDGKGAVDPFVTGLHRLPAAAGALREVDWMPGYRFGVRVRTRFERVGMEEHDILGERRRLLRVDEHFEAETAGFTGVNRYWVDPQDGFVFISEQSLLPGLRLRLTQLRPYRGAGR